MKTIILDGVEYILTPVEKTKQTEQEIIRVPEDIVFVNDEGNTYLMNGNKALRYNEYFESWLVRGYIDDEIADLKVPMQLIKCKYEDIEVGEFFCGIMYGEDIKDFSNLEDYNLKLGNNYQYWGGDIGEPSSLDNRSYKKYAVIYKVVPINE